MLNLLDKIFIVVVKYRRKIFLEEVTKSLLLICFEITTKYEIEFIEIGTDVDRNSGQLSF